MTGPQLALDRFEQELARWGLSLEESLPEWWVAFIDLCDPDGRWSGAGWVPVFDHQEVTVEPTIFTRAVSGFDEPELDLYLRAASLLCALVLRGEDLGVQEADCAIFVDTLLPDSHRLFAAAEAAALGLGPTPPPPGFDPARQVLADVGVDLCWSGHSGTIVEVREHQVLLQIPGGCALTIPDGDWVQREGRVRQLVIAHGRNRLQPDSVA